MEGVIANVSLLSSGLLSGLYAVLVVGIFAAIIGLRARRAPLTLAETVAEEDLEWLHRAVRRRGVPVVDASDVVQNVLIAVVRKQADYLPPPPDASADEARRRRRAWLLGFVSKQVHHYRRRMRDDAALPLEVEDRAPDPEARAGARELLALAMTGISDERLHVLAAHHVVGKTIAEVARDEGIPKPTAASRYAAARSAAVEALARIAARESWTRARRRRST